MADHYCSTHQTVFFKRGKMRGYAHPVKDESGEDTGVWCNEEVMEKVKNLPPGKPAGLLPEHQEVIDKARESVRTYDPTRKSIERQTALKASTEISVAKIAKDKETSLNEILAVALAFESYLESGATIEKKGDS